MNVQTWVTVLLSSGKSFRNRTKRSVLKGMSFFNSKWKKKSSKDRPEYKLRSKDNDVNELVNRLMKEKDFDFVGFTPQISYIKEKGAKAHMEVMWEHKFGLPTLLYAHKSMPILIIAGPNLMFNDSIVKSIKDNKIKDSIHGITG